MVSISSAAANKIKQIIDQENKQGWGLRVGVKGGGCSGFTYVMRFEEEARESDQTVNVDNIRLVIDSKSMIYLAGTEIDFTDGLDGAGFVFKNPNATRSCGCGSSFAV